MAKPFFSVIVPVYNIERYLHVCLKSVLEQEFQDFELILVDDGSKDRSGQICDEYHSEYPEKIQAVHQINQGPAIARETGLAIAGGRYVCFLDGDDCWENNLLSRLYEVILETDADIVLFRWKRIDENGKDLNKPSTAPFPRKGFVEKNVLFEKMLSTMLLNPLWAKCARRELYEGDSECVSTQRIQNGEDLMQSLPIMYRANTFYYLDEALYKYRENTQSITHTYRKGQHAALDVVRPLLFRYIVKLGLDSQKNRNTYYKMYLTGLWRNINTLYRGLPNKSERYAVLDEMHTYEHVKQAKAYLKKVDMPLLARGGLFIFYSGNKSFLNAYMRGYQIVQKLKRALGAAVRH